MNTKNILITGGLGNLGSWLTQHAIDQKFNVTVLAKNEREVYISGKYEIVYADLSDKNSLSAALNGKNFNYILHAGSVNDAFINSYKELAYDVNAFGTRNLLSVINQDYLEHFIYLSTFQVYGIYDGVIDETTIPTPNNDYGLSHLLAEYFIDMEMNPNSYSIIRLTNSYGCPKDYDTSKWYLILNDLSKQAYIKKEIKLSGNGKAVRDFIWMGDVANILLDLIKLKPNNEIYNISHEKTMSMLDVAEIVKSAYEETYNLSIPIIINRNDKSSQSNTLRVKSNKIRKLINFKKSNKMKKEAVNIFRFLEKKK